MSSDRSLFCRLWRARISRRMFFFIAERSPSLRPGAPCCGAGGGICADAVTGDRRHHLVDQAPLGCSAERFDGHGRVIAAARQRYRVARPGQGPRSDGTAAVDLVGGNIPP